ncbi:hypothetical protein QFC21_003756 [Naganishia friedmannii]|uniref:Uncharacterized protein n=1 Tax=Naganishia friedmannii TaxID=89922 RepID=A0ACC2VK30_9TREE|nr:hypothetical protein QFC21_003756 [Naganishia friedmannii]
MPITISPSQQRLGLRLVLGFAGLLVLRSLFFPSSSSSSSRGDKKIQSHGVLERVLLTEKYLDVHKYPFLQHRQGRDDRWDLFDGQVSDGLEDFWTRFQKPFITGKDTAHLDQQVVRGAIDDLFSFNGWVTQGCSTLKRPFAQNSIDEHYEDLAGQGKLYYIAIVIHSADHFLVDQLAVIVQLAKRLGPQNIFVSMLDSASDDSTPTLADLSEAVLITLGIAFRIRRVPPMTVDPSAAYYPLEEATARNAALEPLHELYSKRNVKFHKVIWLKGFTCPNDILESLRVSEVNSAAMVCGMDWAEHNGFFIFSDRWRTRDIEGNLFRQAKSSSKPETGPPRDKIGTERYAAHLPFQTFCCESGTHVVDPEQSYYRNIEYRASNLAQNMSSSEAPVEWDPESQCMDSTQMWFCRDLWTDAARGDVKGGKKVQKLPTGHRKMEGAPHKKRDLPVDDVAPVVPAPAVAAAAAAEEPQVKPREDQPRLQKQDEVKDERESGTDMDNMDDAAEAAAPAPIHPADALPASAFLVPNNVFTPARILVNPRCVTTYGGVSHTQLALDLFGTKGAPGAGNDVSKNKYILEDWAGPPDSFVCQEMRTTGGRTAPKSQRRVGWLLQNEVGGY